MRRCPATTSRPRSPRPAISAKPLLLVVAALLLAAPARAQTLTYLNAPPPGAPITASPHLALSLGGRTVRAIMDTGSTGIVVSADLIPHFAALPGPPGVLAYSSSGRVMHGRWVHALATIGGANGASVTTTHLPVLAVTRAGCLPHARDCRPIAHPRGIAMIGIGFGREADHQHRNTPDTNPFLAIPGIRDRGYIVTRRAVRIGLDAAPRAGFAILRLTRSQRWPDWNQAPACIRANRAPPACGVSLMDTGVVRMYLSIPGPRLDAGTRLRFLLGGKIPVASYGFTLGNHASPMAPEAVVRVRNPRPFVNTTVRFLNGFDYLYDATRGEVGYRPHPLPSR